MHKFSRGIIKGEGINWGLWRLARSRKFNKTKVALLEELYRPYIDSLRRQASHNSKCISLFQMTMTNVPSLRFQIVSQIVSRPCRLSRI